MIDVVLTFDAVKMESESAKPSLLPEDKTSDVQRSAPAIHGQNNSDNYSPSEASDSGLSSGSKSVKVSPPSGEVEGETQSGDGARSTFARFTSGLGLRFPTTGPAPDGSAPGTTGQAGVLRTLTKGIVDSSRSAVKAVQVKARHMVSQNKRRFQEGGFDLDVTYINDNIIAMGFPAGDISSGIFGYIEGFYRNHMEEVIKFLETYHQGKYKVYNLCSERLYDASLFQGKAASFPFDDHNCPPIHLISSFCQSAYTWLKEDIDNVVVVHCKAGLGRTGLMISSLLLYLKFCATAEESMDCFNQKRCVDGKGLVLPSQIRYVKYFERILKDYHGDNPPGRRYFSLHFMFMLLATNFTFVLTYAGTDVCSEDSDFTSVLIGLGHQLRFLITVVQFKFATVFYSFNLVWQLPNVRMYIKSAGILFSTKKHPKTKDLLPEDFWISSSKKGIAVFALPGEPGLAEVTGDFKIHFHDRHGDFYWFVYAPFSSQILGWLNTTLTENRIIINSDDLDGFDKRKLPSPTFQLEIVIIDYNGTVPKRPNTEKSQTRSDGSSDHTLTKNNGGPTKPNKTKSSEKDDEDDVFSDNDGEEGGFSRTTQAQASGVGAASNHVADLTQRTQQMSTEPTQTKSANPVLDGASKSGSVVETPKLGASAVTDFKAIAADASVFSFGDDEDFESE
ncbi:hypothetical protein Cgig2_010356 [Carnegiea gigantea]|uniref:Phosphatidylinositol-3,4,5-trisphosphate 3-phosphatase n=1 Tax=Carnegiea gigantea TaxID=171969 RepID=A0A9Q1QD13_9CARY|nr:hypothetical protein Cgig2_010356 [Carnegiea gigantea]